MTHEALTDRQKYVTLVPEVTEALARPHTEAEGTRLRLLPDDAVAHPAQDPFCFRFPGERQDIAILDAIAAATEPRFPAVMEKLNGDKQALGVIDETSNLLRENKSVWVISPHGDILDIAYVLKATVNLLDRQGHTPRRTISVLSKTLSRVGFELSQGQPPIETVGTMGMMCDDVFLTWPRTKSAKSAIGKLPKGEVDRHNEQALEGIDDELATGDTLAAMAPTGTTRMPTDRSGALILPSPSKGTLDLMMKPNTYVLPVPAWFKSDEVIVSMPTNPVEISEESKAHEMLQFMAEVMTERIEGVNFVYKTPRHIPGQAALERHRPPKL